MNKENEIIAKEGKYLKFQLENEKYGIYLLNIKEIIGMLRITRIPGLSNYIKGVINLRGQIIPTIDLRLKVGLSERDYDDRTCIIIVEMSKLTVGLIVDRVEDVINVSKENIDKFPDVGSKISNKYISGVGKIEKEVVILLDVEKILSEDESKIITEKLK